MRYAEDLLALGFVQDSDSSKRLRFTYTDPATSKVVMHAEIDKREFTSVDYMECDYVYNARIMGAPFISWVEEHIKDATDAHEHAGRALEIIRGTFNSDTFSFREIYDINSPEVQVGVFENGVFIAIQRYSVTVYENELSVRPRTSGRHAPYSLDMNDDPSFLGLRDWIKKPHDKHYTDRSGIERVYEGHTYSVFRSQLGARVLPAFANAKSVKIIRANLCMSFDVDEFDLFKELELTPEVYTFYAYEV